MASNPQQHNQLLTLFAAYAKRLDKLYDDFVTRLIVSLPLSEDEVWQKLADNPLFLFDDLPYLKARLQHIFDDYVNKQVLCYKAGITDGVALAFSQDKINLGKYTILQDEAIKAARAAAVASFIANRMSRKEGLSLSDKVWNYSQLGKSEVEMSISNVIKDGLKTGTSAEELGLKVRQYLNNPDMMYRRYWVTVATAGGGKKRVARWYRRHIDPQTGKVTFTQEPLERVGTGVYRSARMNGYRLMRTEINMSYHKSNASRWAKEPFVYGIRVWKSPQHPKPDICDDLEGYYPKDFVFAGWHPNCMCASAPLTLYGDEKRDFYRRLMKGEDMSNFHSKYEITEANMNPKWKQYIQDQHDSILRAGERGKLAYHLRDNQQYWIGQFSKEEQKRMGLLPEKKTVAQIAAERHARRTPEQAKALTDWWHEHKRKDKINRIAEARHAKRDNNEILAILNVRRNAKVIAQTYKDYHISADGFNAAVKAFDWAKAKKEYELLAPRLTFEKSITPDILVDSVMRKKYGDSAVEALYKNAARTMGKYDAYSMAEKIKKYQFEADWVRKNRSFPTVQEVAAFYEREAARLKTQMEFDALKLRAETLDKQLVNLKLKPILKGTEQYWDKDALDKVLDAYKPYESKLNRLKAVDDFIATVKPKSATVKQLRDGIEYSLSRNGIKADIEDTLSKLERKIEQLKKKALGKVTTLDDLSKALGSNMPATLQNLQAKIDATLKLSTIPPDEQKEFASKMKTLIANSDFCMNVPRIDRNSNDVIEAIFNSYFKNQIETGTGKGMVDVSARKTASLHLFGTDTAIAQAVDYEKYGFLADKDILKQANSGIANQYWSHGDGIQVRFKKDKVIATFTLEDSLGSGRVPSLCSDPRITSGRDYQVSKIVADKQLTSAVEATRKWGSGYIELQYHGKLTLDCIDSVYIPENVVGKIATTTQELIAKSGAKIYSEESGKLIELVWSANDGKLINMANLSK